MKSFVYTTMTLLVLLASTSISMGVYALPTDFTIGVTSEQGTASFVVQDWVFSQFVDSYGKIHNTWCFDCNLPIPLLTESNVEIGVIEKLKIVADADPMVSVDFVCRAGSSATTFTFSNYVDGFSIVNPDTKATASITATDNNDNGVTLTGLFGGGKCYQARYNDPAVVFATLVDGGTAGTGDSYSDNEEDGWRVVGGTVSRMDAQYYFTLSGRDSASGTSNFQMVPEPASLFVLAMSILWVPFIRRRVH